MGSAYAGGRRVPAVKHAVLKPGDLTPDLIERWKDLCRASEIYRSPFYWPQFTLAVGAIRSDTRVAIFEDRGEVIGILPFHRARGRAGKPVGGQLNDYQGPVLATGARIEPADLLEGAGLSSYDYNHLPTAIPALSRGATGFSSSPQMDLSEGYEAFVGRKDKSWTKAKREIRRRCRKTETEFGPLCFTFHDPSDGVFAQHIEMKNKLLERAGTRFRIRRDWIGDVLERLRHVEDEDFSARMTTLHAGDHLLAAHFGLTARGVWHWWFPSYDLGAYKLGPGINLVDQCAMAAEEHGIDTIDFGRGDGAFKLLFADRFVELGEGTIARPGSMARLIRQGTQAAVSAAERLPLGQYRSYPRRAAARLVSGVTLPERKHT